MTTDSQLTANGSEADSQAIEPLAAATPAPAPRHPGGAPAQNQNRLKSGRSAWLQAGRLPRAYKALRRELREQAQGLADEVVRIKGRQPSLYESCLITTAIRHAGRIALLERWLAREHKELSISDRLALLKEIGAASTSRDKALQSLGIDCEPGDSIDDFYAALRSGALDIAPEPANAPGAKSEPLGGNP